MTAVGQANAIFKIGLPVSAGQIILAKIRNLLEAAGGKMADVMKITIFVTDITQRENVWRARREVFAGDFPTSTLVQVAALAEPPVRVEAIAHIGAGMR